MRELDHERYMRRAISLTEHVPHLPIGAVIVDRERDTVLAEGWNKSGLNPTWHGEIDATNQLVANQLIGAHGSQARSELVLYTKAEPCSMCQGAILWSGIGAVVFGMSIPFLQQHGWWQIDIPAEELVRRSPQGKCKIMGGVLEEQCNALFLAAGSSKKGS